MYLYFSYHNRIVAKHQKLENQSFGITTLGTLRKYKTLYSLMDQIFFARSQSQWGLGEECDEGTVLKTSVTLKVE